jgi:hypothetical protein
MTWWALQEIKKIVTILATFQYICSKFQRWHHGICLAKMRKPLINTGYEKWKSKLYEKYLLLNTSLDQGCQNWKHAGQKQPATYFCAIHNTVLSLWKSSESCDRQNKCLLNSICIFLNLFHKTHNLENMELVSLHENMQHQYNLANI